MSKEKQIEEMAQFMWDSLPDYEHNFRDCRAAAEAFYNAGYRKQSKSKWVFAGDGIIQCISCDEVYDAREWPRNYCPNCGAKMEDNKQ